MICKCGHHKNDHSLHNEISRCDICLDLNYIEITRGRNSVDLKYLHWFRNDNLKYLEQLYEKKVQHVR